MKKCLFAFLCAISMLFAEEPFIIGTTSGYAPFVSLNEKGDYEGFDIDLANLLAQKLGKKLVIKDFGSMPSLMLALKQDKVDALIWAISITDDRKKTMEMIHYQGEPVTTMPFLFWKEAPANVSTLENLGSNLQKAVCVEAGSFQEAVVKSSPLLKFKNVEKITDVIFELKYGKVSSAAIDPSLVKRVEMQYPEIKVLRLPIPVDKQALGNGICIAKKNQELAEQVKNAIAQLKNEGKIAELEKKWGIDSP